MERDQLSLIVRSTELMENLLEGDERLLAVDVLLVHLISADNESVIMAELHDLFSSSGLFTSTRLPLVITWPVGFPGLMTTSALMLNPRSLALR